MNLSLYVTVIPECLYHDHQRPGFASGVHRHLPPEDTPLVTGLPELDVSGSAADSGNPDHVQKRPPIHTSEATTNRT